LLLIDLKHDIKELQKLSRGVETWRKFKLHFTRAISDNKKEPRMNEFLVQMQNAVYEHYSCHRQPGKSIIVSACCRKPHQTIKSSVE
jgi:hypothetical protein